MMRAIALFFWLVASPAAAQHRNSDADAGFVGGATGAFAGLAVYHLAVPVDGGFWRDEPRWDDPLALGLALGVGVLSGVAGWALSQGHEERDDLLGFPTVVGIPVAMGLAVVWVVVSLFTGIQNFDGRAFQITVGVTELLGPLVGLVGSTIHFALEGDAPLPPRD